MHHPLGHEGLWHTPDRHVSTVQQLPAYFQNTARALMRDQGMGEQEAIATAVNAVKEWAAGRAFGGKVKVTPEVQQAAQRGARGSGSMLRGKPPPVTRRRKADVPRNQRLSRPTPRPSSPLSLRLLTPVMPQGSR